MLSKSKRFLEVTLTEETECEEANNKMRLLRSSLEEDMINLTLVSKSMDEDHGRLFRKKARAKKVGKHFVCYFFFITFTSKVRDKWNQLVFVPMAVLNRRDLLSGGKAGKREGFNTFNRLPLFHRS